MEVNTAKDLQGLFPLTWPIPTPVTHPNLLSASDLSREEDLQRNPGSLRHWWTAIQTTKDAIIASQKSAPPANPIIENTLGLLSTPEARLGLQKLTYLYEAALVNFPTSFKLWKAYLQMRCLYVMGKSTRPKRAGSRKKLAEMKETLEDELAHAETWEGGLDGVIGWEEWKVLVATFERALIWLPTVRLIHGRVGALLNIKYRCHAYGFYTSQSFSTLNAPLKYPTPMHEEPSTEHYELSHHPSTHEFGPSISYGQSQRVVSRPLAFIEDI